MTDYLGYVAAVEHDDGLPRVCCLVIDAQGRPQEFVYADPQAPSGVQRALWGVALQAELERTATHAAVEKLTLKPAAFLVRDDSLFETLRQSKHVRAIAQVAADEAAAPSNKKNPIVRWHGDDALKEQLTKGDLVIRFDPLEPFDRISAVCGELQE